MPPTPARTALFRAGTAGAGVISFVLALALDRTWLYAAGAALMALPALAWRREHRSPERPPASGSDTGRG